MRFLVGTGLGATLFLSTAAAWAFPGPESTAVLYNADVPESVALAKAYAAARGVPTRQLCGVSVATAADVSLADYRAKIEGPLEQCLTQAGVLPRIEAVLVVRGLPIRVQVPVMSGTQSASVAAALGAWKSTLQGTATPLVGEAPGEAGNCGGPPCTAARWQNPLALVTGPFGAGTAITTDGADWKPLLVTMLHGRSYTDAQKLVDSALAAEKAGGAKGEFLFMNGADAARGVLDDQADMVMPLLTSLGLSSSRVPFASDAGGKTLAAFVTGTAALGQTIEGSTYLPGSIVDNLTSFGAAPANFEPSGETQVSIARWVSMGVAGVHGTVDEPLNNCFPNRRFVSDYASGAPLAEAYLRRMPFAYWRNLVLGDPMAAPYAKRPKVTLESQGLGGGANALSVVATDVAGSGLASVRVYVDGVEAVGSDGGLPSCVTIPAQKDVQVLVVARNAPGAGALAKFPPVGWASVLVDGTVPTSRPCGGGKPAGDASPEGDAGPSPVASSGGCSCDVAPGADRASVLPLAPLALLALRRRRKRV
jgi:MYXO-CTERM domain-containing protein